MSSPPANQCPDCIKPLSPGPCGPLPAATPKADLETQPWFLQIAKLQQTPVLPSPTSQGKTCDTVLPSGNCSLFQGKACNRSCPDAGAPDPVSRHDSSSLQTERPWAHENHPAHSVTRKE